ncbi:protein of unknown function [Mariniphaga anaerophila]|uniref:Pectate lyase superfamily protein n=1 Tax=Mariniphaga anaerophila TaxID=1484053 RepID=A0A1M4SX89_9BACT|nr:DNRLRE domain-containing protein [Mariniphaga anaerophila]SHE36627.1 protein of unknown function [Mariniphaga anaerophila]
MKYRYLITIIALLVVTFRPANAQIKLQAIEDCYINNGEFANDNFGDATKLLIKNGSAGYTREILLKFRNKKNIEVKTAVLFVRGRNFAKDDKKLIIDVLGSDSNWKESKVNWNSKPKAYGTIGTFELIATPKSEWHTVVLDADYVNKHLQEGNLSVTLVQKENNGLMGFILSKESEWAGKIGGMQAYLELNGELPENNENTDATLNATVSPEISQEVILSGPKTISVTTDYSISPNGFSTEELIVKGSSDPQKQVECFLSYDIGSIDGYVVKASLYLNAKALQGAANIQLYDGKGSKLTTPVTWEKRPSTMSNVGNVTIDNNDEFKLYQIDISKFVRTNHNTGKQYCTILLKGDDNGNPVEIGSLASNSKRSFLVVNTIDRKKQETHSDQALAPVYPDVKEDNRLWEQWIKKNPLPENGWVPELWKKYVCQGGISQLHNFSYAGYKYGEEAIPEIQNVRLKVTDFGAVPNDEIDDTDAIQKALDKISNKGGVLLFPKGKYIINGDVDEFKKLTLNSSNVIIRGEGSGNDGTVLFMANKFLPPDGWGDFIFEVGNKKPHLENKAFTELSQNARRGTFQIEVEDASNFSKGDNIQIYLKSHVVNGKRQQELGQILTYPLVPEIEWTNFKKFSPYNTFNQIVSINNNTITLKKPLDIDMDLKWKPTVKRQAFYENIGFENIRFEGNWHGPYIHHGSREMDYGWCALRIANACNSWVKNVAFHNLTWDLTVLESANVTVQNVTVSGTDGHHGIKAPGSSSVLVKDCEFTAHRTHNIGGSGAMDGCVFTNIKITDPHGTIDSHGGGFPVYNLFENITNVKVSGAGSIDNMPHMGRENVFWNLHAQAKEKSSHHSELDNEFFPYGVWNYYDSIKKRGGISFDCYKLYPGSVVIGVYNDAKALQIGQNSEDRNEDFIYVEGLNRTNVWPASLYNAQFNMRLKK